LRPLGRRHGALNEALELIVQRILTADEAVGSFLVDAGRPDFGYHPMREEPETMSSIQV